MAQYTNITYNGVVLNVTNMSPNKKQKTIKQIIGKSLSETPILGLASKQWELKLNGIVFGTTSTNLSNNREAIENLDSATPYSLVDGIHNGTYIVVPDSLTFDDSADDVQMYYKYSMMLVEQ